MTQHLVNHILNPTLRSDHKFDPDKQLITDSQGLTILVGNHKLEHAIKMYNRSRFEDSIEEF
jgi:hypothetical protein